MAKRKQAKRPAPISDTAPTPEQMNAGEFRQGGNMATSLTERAGLAYRRIPVIDTLWNSGQLTEGEYAALAHYRNQASQAEDDVASQSTLSADKIMGGSHGGYIPAMLIATPAIIETGRIEADLGSLRDIARAIAVDDYSLSQWCIGKHGGREKYDSSGKIVAIVPAGDKRNVELARLELKTAAGRITR